MRVRREAIDTLDASFEMPEQYGSRGLWRYFQVRAVVGLIAAPILIALTFVDGTTPVGKAAWILGLVAIASVTVFVVLRDRKVQRLIDATGSPLINREPY